MVGALQLAGCKRPVELGPRNGDEQTPAASGVRWRRVPSTLPNAAFATPRLDVFAPPLAGPSLTVGGTTIIDLRKESAVHHFPTASFVPFADARHKSGDPPPSRFSRDRQFVSPKHERSLEPRSSHPGRRSAPRVPAAASFATRPRNTRFSLPQQPSRSVEPCAKQLQVAASSMRHSQLPVPAVASADVETLWQGEKGRRRRKGGHTESFVGCKWWAVGVDIERETGRRRRLSAIAFSWRFASSRVTFEGAAPR